MATENEIEMAPPLEHSTDHDNIEQIEEEEEDSNEEDQSSRWIIEESTDYVAIDIINPDQDEEDPDEQEEPEMNEEEREDEQQPLNSSDEWKSENSIEIASNFCILGSICRVPKHIREVNENAFTPRILSIGPFHRNNQSLSGMEDHKLRLFNGLVEKNNALLEEMTRAMEEIEPEARSYYSQSFPELSINDFVKMMMIDGCFILQLFRLVHQIIKEKQPTNDPIFKNRWMLPIIGCDMLILENQLPFIVLEELHKLTTPTKDQTTSLNKLALQFFTLFHLGRHKITYNNKKFKEQKHLLAFFQSIYAPNDPNKTRSPRVRANQERRLRNSYKNLNLQARGKNWIRNATKLRYLGIRLFAVQTGNLLEIKFKGSRLGIPTLSIDENNAIIMQNMMAYEQCCRDAKPYMTSLIMFLCSIAVVPDDIAILREATILQHQPGDDQMVIDFLKILSREIDDCGIHESVLFDQVVRINGYCQSSWSNKFRSFFRSSNGQKIIGGFIALVVVYLIKYLFGVNIDVRKIK